MLQGVKYVLKVLRKMNQTMGKRVIVPSEHCGSCCDRWEQKCLTSAQMLRHHRLPVPHFGKTGLVEWKLPRLLDRLLGRLLDIIAEVFYLIHGLYIVVTNNNK